MEVEDDEGRPDLVALANHAFFLKQLPQQEEENLVQIEQSLLERLVSCVMKNLPADKFPNTLETFEGWGWVQGACSYEMVLSELNKLGIGEKGNFSLFVKKQNCLVHMKRLPGEKLRVMTFRGSLPNEMVMKGPIKAEYPERLDVVPISELVMSKCFADQLTNLHLMEVELAMATSSKAGKEFKEIREPCKPLMVSEFLVALLCPDNDESKHWSWLKTEKKVRDSVNWNHCLCPWRRSGLWMDAKVLLNLCILDETGNEEEATIIYKTTLLIFLSEMFQEISQVDIKNWDVLKQMMVNLTRRARKLQGLIWSSTNVELNDKVTEQINRVLSSVEGVHTRLTLEWQKLSDLIDIRNGIRKVPTTVRLLQADCCHFMEELNTYLKGNRQPSLQTQVSTGLESVPEVNQNTELHQLISRGNQLSTSGQDVHLNIQSIWLFQVEVFCRNIPVGLPYSSENVHKLFMRYAEVAIRLFRENPVALSRAVVTLFILLGYLDRVAVDKHSLLAKYQTSVNPSLLEKLLIPEKVEMSRITTIQSYFAKRNIEAVYPSWVECTCLSYNSFAVAYAQQNWEMQTLKRAILEEDEARHLKKREEVDRAKAECDRLQNELRWESCHYTWSKYYEKNFHDYPCRKCTLERELNTKRFSVARIQKTLPKSEVERDGIVFELLVPPEIAHLRDATCVLLGEVLAQTRIIFAPGLGNAQKHWLDFVRDQQRQHSLRDITQLVRLGSTLKDTLATHYNSKNPDVTYSSYDSYYLDNGLNCGYFWTHKLNLGWSLQDLFTMKLSKTSSFELAPYGNLQWALDEKRETENEVLSRQYSCHQKLTLKEFIAFGSLRNGGKIQLRNLYIAMATRTLSIEKEAVLALIMQSLWELGGTDKDGRREIHVDFEDVEFSLEFLDLLQKLVQENESCWGSPLTIISVVTVAIRILELNENQSVRQTVSNLLQRIRQILKSWRVKVDTMLPDADTIQSTHLIKLLLIIEIASALTYNVSRASVLAKFIVRDSNDLCTWLETLSKLQHLIVRENVLQNLDVSTFLRNLLTLARSTIPLQLQEVTKLHADGAVREFVTFKWHEAGRFPIALRQNTGSKAHAVLLKYEIVETGEFHYVCVDTLLGTFLVDGFPPGYLPESIIRSQIFRSFFKTSKFRIQRDSTMFSTCDKYYGRHYKFFGDLNNPFIRELQGGSGDYLELIPKQFFTGMIGFDLIDNYTHWYNPQEGNIIFRQNVTKLEADAKYRTDYVLKMEGDTGIWQLTVGDLGQEETKMISINSETFKSVTAILAKIEKSRYVHLKLKDNEMKALLWRLNVTFKLDNNYGQLYCENYSGFYISHRSSQVGGIRTLIGLQNGLVLEKQCASDITGFKRILLIPHGSLAVNAEPIHQRVTIYVSDGVLRHPPYFTYEVDTVLKRLKPGNDRSAWLYLAGLHASTASSMPDTFTELTGVEMAMWILKSAFIFSCSPYDSECIRTFTQIASFSPIYSWYPSHLQNMQTIRWLPEFGSNSYAQYDGYRITIQKLIGDSRRLSGLFLGTASSTKIPEGNQALTLRTYHLNINFYNQLAHADLDLAKFPNSNSLALLSSSLGDPPGDLLQLAQTRRLKAVSNASSISSVIMTHGSLPLTLSLMAASDQIHDWLQLKSLRNNWLGLYDLILKINASNGVMHQLTFIFAAMIYTGSARLDQILTLHNISVISQSTTFPPVIKSLCGNFEPLSNRPVAYEISAILQSNSKEFSKSESNYDTHREYCAAQDKYNSKVSRLVSRATPQIEALWPVQSISASTLSSFFDVFTILTSKCPSWRNK